MDIINVYVIADIRKFTKDDIVRNIQEEGYKHNFFFGNTLSAKAEDIAPNMTKADEVWCFGDVEGLYEYGYAKSVGKDIWRMG